MNWGPNQEVKLETLGKSLELVNARTLVLEAPPVNSRTCFGYRSLGQTLKHVLRPGNSAPSSPAAFPHRAEFQTSVNTPPHVEGLPASSSAGTPRYPDSTSPRGGEVALAKKKCLAKPLRRPRPRKGYFWLILCHSPADTASPPPRVAPACPATPLRWCLTGPWQPWTNPPQPPPNNTP